MSQTQAHGLLPKAPRGGSAPWPGLGRSPVMLHCPWESLLCVGAGAAPSRSGRSWRFSARTDRSWSAPRGFAVSAEPSRDPQPGELSCQDTTLWTCPRRRGNCGRRPPGTQAQNVRALRNETGGTGWGRREGRLWGLQLRLHPGLEHFRSWWVPRQASWV
ncbi:uncharacterized protein LOC126062965 isoform X1 [Elephas maximus indicus]|uniref:uncharacterized protein LOC126062965 isoform X1 n=1 Tax=Elephas maximus indicus TaxID=99487 RepID=UPI002116C273|nr:uncharacterized protein LOC126062965 isoform X1 [Elephas maximus indicus]